MTCMKPMLEHAASTAAATAARPAAPPARQGERSTVGTSAPMAPWYSIRVTGPFSSDTATLRAPMAPRDDAKVDHALAPAPFAAQSRARPKALGAMPAMPPRSRRRARGSVPLRGSRHHSGAPRDHASYIADWLELLKNDKRAIVTAAAPAQRAADFLHSLQPQLDA
jgi:hypothetical protein